MLVLRCLLLVAILGFMAGCGPKTASPAAPQQFKIGVIPYDNPSKIKEEYTPFGDYLGAKLHRPAEVFVAQDYVGVVQALMSDQIDCAYLNPLSYALFADKMQNTPEHLIPIAMPWVHGSLYYYGVIFTRADGPIKSLADLKGKSFAFTEPTSTSGYLYPYQALVKAGIDPSRDFKETYFASETGVVPAVMRHSADAGAVFEEGISLFGGNQARQLRVLARVGPIANGMLVVRGNVDPETVAALRKAMSDINTDPSGKAALAKLNVDKWVPTDDSVFDPVRSAAKILKLNIKSLPVRKQ